MMRVGVALAFAVGAGCAVDGRALPEWTLDAPDGPHGVALALPDSLDGPLGWRETDFTLTRTIALAPDERGQPLTLAFECFHGPLALTIEGTGVADFGDEDVGEHRFVIPAEQTRNTELQVVLLGRRDWPAYSARGFSLAPRLLHGAAVRPSTTAVFNRSLGIASFAVMGLLGAIYAIMYLLDRDRRENGAAAIVTACTFPMILGWQLGLNRSWDLYASALAGAFVGVAWLSFIAFLHRVFELGRVPRGWQVVLLVISAANLANPISLRVTAVLDEVTNPFVLAAMIYVIVLLIRCLRNPAQRGDAWTLLITLMFVIAIMLVQFMLPGLVGWQPLGAVHTYSVGLVIVAIAMGVVLSRQHVARRRALERTARELRHQVAERSRDLADALARLAQAPRLELEPERLVDGRYRVVRHLGAGGMGSVHEVERTSDGARLALKTVRGNVDAEILARFAREAQIATALEHPNLVPVLDVGAAESGLYMVMPLVDGPLDRERARFGDAAWARPLLVEIATGLAALHSRGIVHRDLKPANVLLDRGRARIADFGLASLGLVDPLAESTLGRGLTRAGIVFGTPRYMAPELVAGADAATPASDVFAFGVIAVELLAATLPFTEPPVFAQRDGRTLLDPDLGGLAGPLRDIVIRCLAFDPETRPDAATLARSFSVDQDP